MLIVGTGKWLGTEPFEHGLVHPRIINANSLRSIDNAYCTTAVVVVVEIYILSFAKLLRYDRHGRDRVIIVRFPVFYYASQTRRTATLIVLNEF